MLALVHSIDDFEVFPQTSLVVEGVPGRVFNISLIGEHQVSISPFHSPDGVNVQPGEITSFDFTRDEVGNFPIYHELHGFEGTLIVEDAP